MASITGTMNSSLFVPQPAGVCSRANSGGMAPATKHPTSAGQGGKANAGHMAVGLRKTGAAQTGLDPAPGEHGTISVRLKAVVVASTGLVRGGETGTMVVTLKKVGVAMVGNRARAGGGGVIGAMAVTLPKIQTFSTVLIPNEIDGSVEAVTQLIRQDGEGLFHFAGPAGRAVAWAIVSGGGTLTPLSLYTDDHGIAYARYIAGGFVGVVEIGVTFAP